MRPRHVTGPLYRLRGLVISNVWVLDGGRGDRWIIDSGHAFERLTVLAGLRAVGFSPSEFNGVLLTHRHSDHAGNARFLRNRLGIKVFAHRADAEALDGTIPVPRLVPSTRDPIAHTFAAFENASPARVPIDRALDHGDEIGSLEVHHAPGHTPGSALFLHEATSSLLSGDALLAAVPPLTLIQRMALPSLDFSSDFDRALESLRRLHAEGLAYENLLSGHGRPILGGAKRAAERLLET